MHLLIALRTEAEHTPVFRVKQWLEMTKATGVATCEKAGTSDQHYHWYLEIDSTTIDAVRASFKRVCGATGNREYSMKRIGEDPEDRLKYLRYICKGTGPDFATQGPDVAWRYSIEIDDAFIAARHQEYWEENSRMKKKKTTVMEAVYNECLQRHIQHYERREISRQYILELVRRDKPINLYAAKSAVNSLQVKLGGSTEAVELFCDIIEKL